MWHLIYLKTKRIPLCWDAWLAQSVEWHSSFIYLNFFLKILFTFLTEYKQGRQQRERGRERSRPQAEQGAGYRAGSQDLGIMTGVEGRGLTG